METPSLSLPTRLSLAATVVFIVSMVTADVMAVRALRENLSDSVSTSLSGMITRMARQLDQDVVNLRELLAGEAKRVAGIADDAARDSLARNGAFLNYAFDYGVLLVDAAGDVQADSRSRNIWNTVNLAEQEFFQRTFALKRPIVSEPFSSPTADAAPLVMFTAPITNADGKMVGMLAGGVNLIDNRVLAQPTGIRTSRYGQIGIFTLDGQVVAHTEKELVLNRFENPFPDLEDATARQTMEVSGPDGSKALLAAAKLENADWIIAGVFPSQEVYAPIEQGIAAAHWWFGAGLAMCCVLVWFISGRMVRDLNTLAEEVKTITVEEQAPTNARVGASHRGEAGMLARSINDMLARLEGAGKEIDELSNRLVDAEERQRRAIAADLHDSVCQTLALANMKLGGVGKRLANAADAKTISEIRNLLEQSVGELKTLTFDLSPTILYELGLPAALEWQAGEFTKKFGLTATTASDADIGEIGDEQAIFLYRSAGELLANAAKHSGARQVRVSVARKDADLIMEVSDDGNGIGNAALAGKGFGLRHLKQRAGQLGGQATIEGRAGAGTSVRISLPAT